MIKDEIISERIERAKNSFPNVLKHIITIGIFSAIVPHPIGILNKRYKINARPDTPANGNSAFAAKL